MTEKMFKLKHRSNRCSACDKRLACSLVDAICQLVTPCAVCEIRNTCTKLCDQMQAYLNRGTQHGISTTSFNSSPQLEDFFSFINYKQSLGSTRSYDHISFSEIPWKALKPVEEQIVRGIFLEGKSYSNIAKRHGLTASRIYKIVHGGRNSRGALKKLEEFSKYQILSKKYARYLEPKYEEILTRYYLNYQKIWEIKKITETTRTVYLRLQKARNLLLDFDEERK